MKILVLNGSPKGMTSATMQYIHYIANNFPQHDLTIENISQPIKKIENKTEIFDSIIDKVRNSDAVIWAFPVYYMLVPGHYKRFIELIWERNAEAAFKDKPAAIITTSIKYMDHAACYYMQAICEDLGMLLMGQFTPSMYDLENEQGQKKTLIFARNLFADIERKSLFPRGYPPVFRQEFNYQPGAAESKISTKGKRVLIITDHEDHDHNLKNMINRFAACFAEEIEIINLRDVETKGSCLGCIKCWYDHACIYNDGFIDFMQDKVLKADVMIWAGTVKDRFLSSKWKIFLDRSFCNGHVPWLNNVQVGYLVSGPLSQTPNIREVLEVILELTNANACGFITDECCDSASIDKQIDDMADRMMRYTVDGYCRPMTYLGYGSNLVLREVFWGRFRFPFVADWRHRFSKLDEFKFPHSDYKTRLKNTVLMQLAHSEKFRKNVTKNLKQELIKPLKKVVTNERE